VVSRAAVVPVIHHEQPRALAITLRSLLRAGFVPVVVFDRLGAEVVRLVSGLRGEGVELVPVHGTTWISSGDVGVGQARDAGFRHAVELGFDCIATADSHVYLLDSAGALCSAALEHGGAQGTRIDAPFWQWPHSGWGPPWHGRMYSVSLTRHVDVMSCRVKPWSYEPLLAFSARALRDLMDAQHGRVVVGRGFGAELADVTVSISRLGYRVACSPVRYVHRASGGEEEFWRARWRSPLQVRYWRESFGAYVLKHVPDWVPTPYREFARALEPWQVAACEEFRRRARRDIFSVYAEFIASAPEVRGSLHELLL
jgi:hypothetical protein